MVLTSCIHINNPLTGGDSWDNSSNRVAAEILTEGSATNRKFKEWLDRLADIAHNLRGSDGKLIPVIFRPFHEHTQTWSWWGRVVHDDRRVHQPVEIHGEVSARHEGRA